MIKLQLHLWRELPGMPSALGAHRFLSTTHFAASCDSYLCTCALLYLHYWESWACLWRGCERLFIFLSPSTCSFFGTFVSPGNVRSLPSPCPAPLCACAVCLSPFWVHDPRPAHSRTTSVSTPASLPSALHQIPFVGTHLSKQTTSFLNHNWGASLLQTRSFSFV
jgi:hypothetical protein